MSTVGLPSRTIDQHITLLRINKGLKAVSGFADESRLLRAQKIFPGNGRSTKAAGIAVSAFALPTCELHRLLNCLLAARWDITKTSNEQFPLWIPIS